MTAPQFQLKCLGEPSITGLDGQPLRIRVRKHVGLLVYLVVERDRRHRREHLAELLWPNLPEADGKHSLATAVTSLRAAFGTDVVETDRGGLRWAFGDLAVDLDRLAGGDVLGDETGDGLLDVGTFLQGFEIPGATEFMLWRERQRATWLPRITDALVLLMDRCRRTGDSRQIEQLADRMLALDDLSEEAIRAKMEARAFAGDRLSALRIFEAWKERLHDELGAEPSPQIEGMAVRLRKRGWERTSHRTIAAVRTEQWKNRPFIGRRQEYRVLYEAWERTRRGEPGHVLVAGESGVGKSTLVERLTTAAGLEGASVSRVQCYELEREIPFAAIGGLVHGLLDRPGAAATSPDALAELARAVPEVRRRYANLPAAVETDGETARYRIAESLHQLVRSVADEHPLILVVDDHHLADDASLALIHILLRRVASDPVMLVLVARPSDMGASPHAVKLRDNLARFGTETVNIAPLGADDSAELVATLLAPGERQASPAVRRALLHAGCGYPMAMELLCRDWLEHGERSLVLTLDAMTVDPATAGAPMEAIQQLHQRVTATMSPVARAVLDLSALLGSRLNDLGMYDILDLSVGQVLEGMTVLTDNRVLRDHGASLDFSNELFRAHVYLEIPSTLRRALHGAVADKLIDAERDGESVPGLEIAWHCMRSGQRERGLKYLVLGARQALDRGAPLEVDLAISSCDVELNRAESSELALLLCEAKQESGDWYGSLQLLDQFGDGNGEETENRKYVLRAEAEFNLGQASLLESAETQQTLERITRQALGDRVTCRAYNILSSLVYRRRDREAAARMLQMQPRGRPASCAAATEMAFSQAMLCSLLGQFVRGEELLRKALMDAESSQLCNSAVGLAQNGLAALLVSKARYDDAVPELLKAHNTARQLDNPSLVARTAANLALCFHRLGMWSEVLSWSSIAQDQDPHPGGHVAAMNAYHRAVALAMKGDRIGAVSCIQKVSVQSCAELPAWRQQAILLCQADVYWLVGKKGKARALALAAIRQFDFRPLSQSYAGSFSRWVAELATDHNLVALAIKWFSEAEAELHDLDVLDQVEFLCSAQRVAEMGNWIPSTDDVIGEIEARLSKMPVGTIRQLQRWDLLLDPSRRTPKGGARPSDLS